MSPAPSTARAIIDRIIDFDRANTSVAAPKRATPVNIASPACLRIGRAASTRATMVAPMAGELRNWPKPRAPTCRMSLANTGSRAVAPPSSTATRSSEIEPNTIFWRQT